MPREKVNKDTPTVHKKAPRKQQTHREARPPHSSEYGHGQLYPDRTRTLPIEKMWSMNP